MKYIVFFYSDVLGRQQEAMLFKSQYVFGFPNLFSVMLEKSRTEGSLNWFFQP